MTTLRLTTFTFAIFLVAGLFGSDKHANAALLAGWDDWADTTKPYVADDVLVGFSGTVDHLGTDSTHNSFGSTDGTYVSTLAGANATGNPALLINDLETPMTIVLTNNTGSSYNIEKIHFDWTSKDTGDESVDSFTLTYVSGGLGPASTVIAAVGPTSPSPNLNIGDLPDYEYTLSSSLTDIQLDNGEAATFTIAFSGGDGVAESSVFDNLAFSGSEAPATGTAPEPSTLLLAAFGLIGLALRRRRRR